MFWSAGDAVYGMTTGVGMRKRIRIGADEHEEFNRAMIRNHRIGQGPPFADDVVRASDAAPREFLRLRPAGRPAQLWQPGWSTP